MSTSPPHFKIIPSTSIPWPTKWERQPDFLPYRTWLMPCMLGIYPHQAQSVMIFQVFMLISAWVVSMQAREVLEVWSFQNTWKPGYTSQASKKKTAGLSKERIVQSTGAPFANQLPDASRSSSETSPSESHYNALWGVVVAGKYQVFPLQRTRSRAVSYGLSLGSSPCGSLQDAFPSFPILPRQRGTVFFPFYFSEWFQREFLVNCTYGKIYKDLRSTAMFHSK